MTVCLLAISDGRHEYHHRSLRSALEHLPKFDQYVFVDDPDHALGYAGAIQRGWELVETDHVAHAEADFVFLNTVPIRGMIELLERQPQLAQVVLKRQVWNDEERAAGGIVECHPDDFQERRDGNAVWTEHRRFFSTNPSVYSSRLCEMGWPQEAHSEGVFTHRLLKDPHLRFAFWGSKFAPPLVQHIGEARTGGGY
jgi:hypothetical protein